MEKQILNRHLPIVAIVGRPNVGKSTLFNRVTGHQRKAVVLDTPGITRDRNYHVAEWEGRHFLLIDTGGYEMDPSQPLLRQMREQTLMAVEEADVIILLTAIDEPMNPTDDDVMTILRRTRKPVFLAVNRCDNRERRDLASVEFARFGADRVYGISALHGNGTNELLDALVDALPEDREAPLPEEGVRIAVVGRPNVGKSTLVNRILGFERTIASAIPGTTRDSVDTTFVRDGTTYTLIDTAGIRRRGKIERGAEKLSAVSAMMSLERCDIAIIVIDATDGLTDQDAHVAGYAVDAGCGVILAVNKWDAIEKDDRTAGSFALDLRERLGFMRHAPIIQISALNGQRVEKLFGLVDKVYAEYTKEIDTSELNQFLKRATTRLSPPVHSGRQAKIKYITQTGIRPPTFVMFVNDPKLLHFSYQRFLSNQMREEYGFEGVPIRLRFRKKAEESPFGPKKRG